MQEAHALGLAVLGEAAVERRGMVVRLKQVRVLAKMRVPVGMANECVLEAVRLLDGCEPGIELFGFSDSRGEPTAKLKLDLRLANGRMVAYMRGQGASNMICSHTAPPSC